MKLLLKVKTYKRVYVIQCQLSHAPQTGQGNRKSTHLVTVAPLVVLGADVLVGVFGALLQGRHVVPVVPVGVPQPVGVGSGESEGGNHGASNHRQPRPICNTFRHNKAPPSEFADPHSNSPIVPTIQGH